MYSWHIRLSRKEGFLWSKKIFVLMDLSAFGEGEKPPENKIYTQTLQSLHSKHLTQTVYNEMHEM